MTDEFRTGYFPWVLERKSILLALYGRISEKEKVLLDKQVKGIRYEDPKTVVTCTDGTTYYGDVVVGADGVHSVVRNEMWRLSEMEKPGSVSKTDKTCEYPRLPRMYSS